jgi:hypothetical protein
MVDETAKRQAMLTRDLEIVMVVTGKYVGDGMSLIQMRIIINKI